MENPATSPRRSRTRENGGQQEAGAAPGLERRRRCALRRAAAELSAARRLAQEAASRSARTDRQCAGGGERGADGARRCSMATTTCLGSFGSTRRRAATSRLRFEPVHEERRHRHSAPARGDGRGAVLGGVPADQRSPSGAHDARADRPHPPHGGGAPGRLPSGAAGGGLRKGESARQDRLVHRGRGRRRAREFAEPPAHLACGGRAADDALPQRNARLGRLGD